VKYGGSENISGRKSSIELNTYVALAVDMLCQIDKMGSGIMTTCIPAAKAAVTPLGDSSNTKNYKNIYYNLLYNMHVYYFIIYLLYRVIIFHIG